VGRSGFGIIDDARFELQPFCEFPAATQRIIVDSEVNFGEVAFPMRSTMKQKISFRGTAWAVPRNKASIFGIQVY
jgi:hypothetical protein